MKKHLLVVMVLLMSLALLAGACTNTEQPAGDDGQNTTAETKIVTDMVGRQVEIPADPQRIGASAPNEVITFLMFEDIDKLVATYNSTYDEYKPYYPQMSDFEYMPFGDDAINEEELLNADLDLVFLRATSADDERIAVLENLGIPCLVCNCNTFDTLKELVTLFGEVLNKQDFAQQYCDYVDDNLAAAAAFGNSYEGEEITVLGVWPVETGQYRVPDVSLCVPMIIDMIGAVPAYQGTETIVMGIEEIMELDPDIIVSLHWASFNEILDNDEAFQGLRAMTEGNYKVNPAGFALYTSASLENAMEPLLLMNLIYGEEVSGINAEDVIRDFYQTFFHLELTDGQINNCVNAIGLS